MRGSEQQQATRLTLISPAQRVPKDHPLRRIKKFCDDALKQLSPTFDAMYAAGGRRSIPPETLLKSTLLMAPYPVASARAFCEELDDNLL
jgi:transposase